MKKMLFTAFLLVAGMVVSENLNAQTVPQNGKNYMPVPTAPPAVRAAAEAWYAEFEITAAESGFLIGPLSYYVKGGYFYAIVDVEVNGWPGVKTGVVYNAKGEVF